MKTAQLAVDPRVGSKGGVPVFVLGVFVVVFFLTGHQWNQSTIELEWRQFLFTGRGTDYLAERIDLVSKGDVRRRILFPALGLWGIWSLLSNGLRFPKISPTIAVPCFLLIYWAVMSLFWSDNPLMSTKRLVIFSSFAVGALAVSTRYKTRQIVLLAFAVTGVFLAVGITAEIVLGNFEIFAGGYRFSGTLPPNLQGLNCAICSISAFLLWRFKEDSRKVYFFGGIISFLFLCLTRSRTSFAACLISITLYRLIVSPASRKAFAIFVLLIVISLAALTVGDIMLPYLGWGLNLGRGAEGVESLNGRTWLWMECRGYAAGHKLVGYGFNSFWTPERIREISETQNWTIASAHNVYIDVVLELGLVGLALFAAVLASTLLKTTKMVRKRPELWVSFCFCFLIFFVLNGLLESLLIHPGFPAFLSMIVVCKLGWTGGDGSQEDLREGRDWSR